MLQSIDLNCDLGESFGNYLIGNDDLIMPYITSCNVACGFHGGDPLHIYNTLQNAKKHGLRVGVHPGYPDLNGFGRRDLKMSPKELSTSVIYQISAVIGMANSMGIQVSYVKPHGAMYNAMAEQEEIALTVIDAVKQVDEKLSIMGLAGSDLAIWTRRQDMDFIAEAFADRSYHENGRLVPRSHSQAVILDPQQVLEQVINIIENSRVRSLNGPFVSMDADSICIHGDNKNVVAILKAISEEIGR